MLSFDLAQYSPRAPILLAGDLTLRPPHLDDYQSWLALREESRAHLTRWEPDWRAEDASRDAFKARLRSYERHVRAKAGLVLHVWLRSSNSLVGGVTLSDIRRHASWSATIGYWIGAPYLRRGYGLSAVRAMLDHAFDDIGLNRVEAACQPGNIASRALLQKAGFAEEGLARDYLHINGAWRDHLLFAVTARAWRGAPAEPTEPPRLP